MGTTFGKKRQEAAEKAWLKAIAEVTAQNRKIADEWDLKALHEQANAAISGKSGKTKDGKVYSATEIKNARAALRAIDISKGREPAPITYTNKGFGIIKNAVKDDVEDTVESPSETVATAAEFLAGGTGAMASHERSSVKNRASARLANIHGTIESGEERYAGTAAKPPSRGTARETKAKADANAARYRKLVEMGVAGTPSLDQGLKERYGVTPVKSITPEKVKTSRPDQSLVTEVANWLVGKNLSAAQALNNTALAKRQKDVLRWMIDYDIDIARAAVGDHAADARVIAPIKTVAAINTDVARSAAGSHSADARLTGTLSSAANWLASPVVPTKPKPKPKPTTSTKRYKKPPKKYRGGGL